MREIKFEYVCKHAYAGDERIFKHVLDLHSIEDTYDIVELICSEIDPCTCSFNESQNYCDCDSILDRGEFEIIARRQYTGLKDRNGVNIYEGDVIAFSSNWDSHVCTVEFQDCSFTFGKQIKGYLGINDGCSICEFTDGSGCDGYVVIGNVHANPELLEKQL